MAHTKRITSPSFWGGGKKKWYWAPTPKPGKHPRRRALTVLSAVRDVLHLASKSREVKFMLSKRDISVDGKLATRMNIGLGLMDVLSFGTTGKYFRVVPAKAGLGLVAIHAAEAHLKLLRLIRKNSLRAGKVQLTFHDGRTLLVSVAEAKSHATGDSALFDLKTLKVKETLKLEKGVLAIVFDGAHKGQLGKISEVRHNVRGEDTVVLDVGAKHIETLKSYIMPVGMKTPSVKVNAND